MLARVGTSCLGIPRAVLYKPECMRTRMGAAVATATKRAMTPVNFILKEFRSGLERVYRFDVRNSRCFSEKPLEVVDKRSEVQRMQVNEADDG